MLINSFMLTANNADLVEKAQKLYGQHISAATRRAYLSDWQIFNHWCSKHGCLPENITPYTLALFLTEQFHDKIQPSTLTRRIAAIKFGFTQKQLPSPTDHPLIKNILKGIRRDQSIIIASDQNSNNFNKDRSLKKIKKAITVDILKHMVDLCSSDSLKGCRDKAILLLGFSGGFRRSELAALQIEDLVFNDKGIDIQIRKSKTDQEAAGKLKAIIKAQDKNYCPVHALKIWLKKTQLTHGPVFRGFSKHHAIKSTALSTDRIYALVKNYVQDAGFSFTDFSPHGLRSGFITSALEKGALPSKIIEVTHHASFKSLQPYIKHADRFKQHPAKDLL